LSNKYATTRQKCIIDGTSQLCYACSPVAEYRRASPGPVWADQKVLWAHHSMNMRLS